MADDNPTSVAVARPGRGWRILLVASLALNLAVAGLVVGLYISGPLGGGPPRGVDLGVGPITRALAPDDRDAVRRALRREMQGDARGQADRAARIGEILAVLRSEPFAPDALLEVFRRQAAASAALQQRAQGVVASHVAAMSADERAAFADRLAQEAARGPRDREPPPRRN